MKSISKKLKIKFKTKKIENSVTTSASKVNNSAEAPVKLFTASDGQLKNSDHSLRNSDGTQSTNIKTMNNDVIKTQRDAPPHHPNGKIDDVSGKSLSYRKREQNATSRGGTSFSSSSSFKRLEQDFLESASFASFSEFNSYGSRSPSSSLASSPASSVLSLSVASEQSSFSQILDQCTRSLSPVMERREKSSSGIWKKFPFHRKVHPLKKQSSMSNLSEERKLEEGRHSRSHSVCSSDLRDATKLLDRLKETNAALEIEVRGKDEEVRILSATIDQVNQTWTNKVEGVKKALEDSQRQNVLLSAMLVKEAAQASSSKPAKKVPVERRKKNSETGSISSPSASVSSFNMTNGNWDATRKNRSIRSFVKTDDVKRRLLNALAASKCLSQLSTEDIDSIADAMKSKRINKGERLMQEGMVGHAFYVLAEGECFIYKQSRDPSSSAFQARRTVQLWEVFGEADVYYNTKRVWSCQCNRRGFVWYLTKNEFKAVTMKQDVRKRRLEIFNVLREVKALQKLSNTQLRELARTSKIVQYANGDYIIKQGFRNNYVYVLKEGEVSTTKIEGGVEVRRSKYPPGEIFGDARFNQSLSDCNVIASGGNEVVQCVAIDRKYLDRIPSHVIAHEDDVTPSAVEASLATLDAADEAGDGVRSTTSGHTGSGSSSSGYSSDPHNAKDAERKSARRQPYSAAYTSQFLEIANQAGGKTADDFNFLTTIGHGAYGRVELATLRTDESQVFAVKKLAKYEVVAAENQRNVFNEKNLQMEVSKSCPFVASLYSTFKDTRYLYMVMEYCCGGELFSLLSHAKWFDDKMARFYAGCTVEALAFLHAKRIIFRDLKPENVVFDSQGYCKLTDFGFAKRVSNNSTLRTYTFCGTPEYMAPETLLYQAQTFSVDLWSLGVFIFEMLNGSAPFRNKNRDVLSASILRGIESKLEAVRETKRIGLAASSLIKSLCHMRPEDRLGAGRNGISDVAKHTWFHHLNWGALRKRTLKPPWLPKLSHACDIRYFSPSDKRMNEWNISEDLSGWDENF